MSHKSVLRALHEDRTRLYHLQKLEAMTHEDYLPYLNFVRWYLQQTAANQTFPGYVFLTDEATSTLLSMFNIHNSHLWAHGNTDGTIAHVNQERFSINVWTYIV